MAQNIRRYKGVRPIPQQEGFDKIKTDGDFSDWRSIENEFRDTRGDTFHRDATGYAGVKYTNNSGRNDIITSKAAIDKEQLCFYAETSSPLTPHTDQNWMLLLIDADNDSGTGWFGYDYLVNKKVKSENSTTLMKYENEQWMEVSELNYHYAGNELEIEIPRRLLNISQDQFVIDFKWSDNPGELDDPISLCLEGDTAPNRRFNYRLIWKK